MVSGCQLVEEGSEDGMLSLAKRRRPLLGTGLFEGFDASDAAVLVLFRRKVEPPDDVLDGSLEGAKSGDFSLSAK